MDEPWVDVNDDVCDDPMLAAVLPLPLPLTKLTERRNAALTSVSTSPIGLPIVVELLPAKRSATGLEVPSLLTIKEPESPPALNVVLLMTTWLV